MAGVAGAAGFQEPPHPPPPPPPSPPALGVADCCWVPQLGLSSHEEYTRRVFGWIRCCCCWRSCHLWRQSKHTEEVLCFCFRWLFPCQPSIRLIPTDFAFDVVVIEQCAHWEAHLPATVRPSSSCSITGHSLPSRTRPERRWNKSLARQPRWNFVTYTGDPFRYWCCSAQRFNIKVGTQ